MKSDTKIEEELTCHFKIDMTNLTNFDSSSRKCYVMFDDTEEFEGKLACGFKNDVRNLANLHMLK